MCGRVHLQSHHVEACSSLSGMKDIPLWVHAHISKLPHMLTVQQRLQISLFIAQIRKLKTTTKVCCVHVLCCISRPLRQGTLLWRCCIPSCSCNVYPDGTSKPTEKFGNRKIVSVNFLRKYLQYAKANFHPVLNEEVLCRSPASVMLSCPI